MPDPNYFPTIDDMINLPEPGDVQISPDGCYVAYTVSQPDWEQDERVTQIWLAGEAVSEPIQLTFAKGSSRMPRWSPDGKWLVFLSQRGEDKTPQIYRMSPFGGEAIQLSLLEGTIGTLVWSPSGEKIAFTLTDSEDDTLKKRKEKYGDYRVDDLDYQRAQLWVLDVETKKTEKLTGCNLYHVSSLDWSPDGEKIAFESWPTPEVKDYANATLLVIELNNHRVETLVEKQGSTPRWSPDGEEIAFVRYQVPGMMLNTDICVIDADGGNPRVITGDFDEDPSLLNWGKDGIYFEARQRTTAHLFRIDPKNGQFVHLTPVDISGWISQDHSFSKDHTWMACSAADQQHYLEVARFNLVEGTFERLTSFNQQVQMWNLGQKELIQWTSQDGTPIEGVLTKPVDFDPAKTYPLLVVIHGGPTGTSFLGKMTGIERYLYPCQQWAAKGSLILEPNYRGSGGYGEDFRKLNVRNLGIGDYWDVISGVDALIEKGWADPERVGSMGWSQGGYISAFITTYSDRFKAISVGAGISNWVTYYVNTDIHPFTREYLQATPWEDMEVYRKTSPMTYINKAKTPTLIQHGDQDPRVPVPNAFELYQGLIDVGVEARLIVYPGMPHSTDKPRTLRQIMQSNFDWFNRWIWGEQASEDEAITLYVAIASGEKNDSEENLPAIERYQGKLVQDVYKWAKRDRAGFYLFSGEFGLVDTDFPTPPKERALLPEDVSPMSIRITELLRDEGVKKLIFYTLPVKENPWMLIYLGCLQVAAGLAGNVTIEHQEID